MPPPIRSILLIAGEASSDTLGAELVTALRQHPTLAAQAEPVAFFGAGGGRMRNAGVDVLVPLAERAVFGPLEALAEYPFFRNAFHTLLAAAARRQPDVVVLIDSAGFNRRFAAALRAQTRAATGPFHNWNPRIVYFVSPQVWASRPGRAQQLARDIDLLLSIFPFEKDWYARNAPDLRVEFVGHPMLDRHPNRPRPTAAPSVHDACRQAGVPAESAQSTAAPPLLLLLPGSRRKEMARHWPIMAEAAHTLAREFNLTPRAVLPSDTAMTWLRAVAGNSSSKIEVQVGGLADSLLQARIALASSGTVTMECALYRVPTVVLYRLAWPIYQIARHLVTVRHIAMPNLLADTTLFPELIQNQATPEQIVAAARPLLADARLRAQLQHQLDAVIARLGAPGAIRRAADAIVRCHANLGSVQK